MNKNLAKKIDEFLKVKLKQPRDGGYPPVDDKVLGDLQKILEMLIEGKCEKDYRGCTPIWYRLINRTTHHGLSYLPRPYEREDMSKEEIDDLVRMLDYNLGIAYRDVEMQFKIFSHYLRSGELQWHPRKK